MIARKRLREADVLLEIFIFANFAFLSLDIYVAHSINRFRHWAEWIPFVFSIAAALALLPGVIRSLGRGEHWQPSPVGSAVGTLAILVGIAAFLVSIAAVVVIVDTVLDDDDDGRHDGRRYADSGAVPRKTPGWTPATNIRTS